VHFVTLKKHLIKAFILNVTIVRCHKSDFLPVVFSAAAVGNFLVIVRKLFLSQTQTQTDDSALRHASITWQESAPTSEQRFVTYTSPRDTMLRLNVCFCLERYNVNN